MGKVSGAYDSVIRGVSEQTPHERRSGQHTTQDNFLSDPVRGLCRRRGSVFKAQRLETAEILNAGVAYDMVGKMRAYDFVIDGVAYVLLYRHEASTGGKGCFATLYNKTTDEFLPIVYENSTWVQNLISGGVSAIANLGKYLYIAGNTTIPTATQTNVWETPANQNRMAVWVRGGAYSRTFKISLTRAVGGPPLEVSYTTKPSAYPELLDTSDINFWADPPTNSIPREDYQKDINDRVNAYQSAVNAWISEAAADIVPTNIAEELEALLMAEGVSVEVVGSSVVIDDADFTDVSCDDGGDGSLMIAVGQEVRSATAVGLHHYVGKVVQVRPTGSTANDVFYLEAHAKDGVSTGWTEVVWREGAGVKQTIDQMLSIGLIHNGTLYISRDAAGLAALAPSSGEHPGFKPALVGDGRSNPLPYFIGRKITMLSAFQDRLLIGSGGTVNASRSGDYLQFFRQTILNVLDNDAVEMFAHGSEGDVLRHAVMYDKDMLLFGDLRQYGIGGRQVLSAKAPNITTVSSHDRASVAAPVASGNYVFYGKNARREGGELRTTLNQLQIGTLTEAPVSSEVSQQLDTYIQGTPAQVVAMTSPLLVLLRTEELANVVYVYNFVDRNDGGERLSDAWSRWVFNPVLGRLCGLSQHEGSALLFYVRRVEDQWYWVCDQQSLNGAVSDHPYLDSACPLPAVTGKWHELMEDELAIAAGKPSPYHLLGTQWKWLEEMTEQLDGLNPAHLWVGAVSEAVVTPTNPFFRDGNDVPVLTGQLTLGTVLPHIADTAGLIAEVTDANGTRVVLDYNARDAGHPTNLPSAQPRASKHVVIGVGREIRQCSYTIRSKAWLPVNITAIEWVGNYFNRTRRG